MKNESTPIQNLAQIKKMMEQSSRFVSLSGLSGIAAGASALVGAWFGYHEIAAHRGAITNLKYAPKTAPVYANGLDIREFIGEKLFVIAIGTFAAAFVLSFFFTFLRSKKTNIPLWGSSARRLMIQVAVPLAAGGIYLLKLIENGAFGFIASGCLLFYGLALVNASKFTLSEVKYLGYCQILLGVINVFFVGYGLYFWTLGFGILHIVYGAIMWLKYERVSQ